MHVSFQIRVFSRYMPRSGIAGSYGESIFSLVFLFFFFSVVPHGLWDLSSLTRDQTQAPAVEAQSPDQRTAREFPIFSLLRNLHIGT